MKNSLLFTDEELRTLVWAINNQYHRTYRQMVESGKKPSESDTINRLLEISKKAYGELTQRYN